ncbi:MAG: dethiobiotin synthase [Pseudomonadota bacterium]|nr:dethiobiotin synthase [Pseudomonadota bacterium]
MTGGIFVTGTDTGAGKTTVACALLRKYATGGLRVVGMKPVAAGGGAANGDIVALAAAGNVDAPLSMRCPYAFEHAIAPHLAAREAGVTIALDRIVESYYALKARADYVVVEGAGGALAPVSERLDVLDIARALSLPVLMVVGMRLGCLNHALLTALAIRARGLELVGWVANSIDPAMARRDENVAALERRLSAPRLASVGWSPADAPERSEIGGTVNFSRYLDPC